MISADVDIAIIGAGAAGLGAAHRLRGADLTSLVVEARDRVGGRAHTLTGRSGAAIDLGCGWLHSADQNEWVGIGEALGFAIDRSPPSWTKPAMEVNFPVADQRAYRAAFEAFEAKLAAAADGPDRAASTLMDAAEARWAPLLNAFSGYYNGAPFDDISVHDYAAYDPTDENWRVRKGYGALMSAFAHNLPTLLEAPVSRLDHGGERLKLSTPKGEITARAAIITVPTGVLAGEGLRFDPALPQVLEAAAALPLGHVDKAFLRLAEPQAFPVDQHLFGRTDTADTASYTFRPLGNGVIEGFFGGALAAALEAEGEGAFCAYAIDDLARLLGSNLRRTLTPIAQSCWGLDPFSLGAYSHARPGFAAMRAVLARPVRDRLFFAGEACSPHAFSTAHGAYETGVAAADAALALVASL